ncbi:MAG: glycerol-3-phosphate acyltransferase [bacterium]|jgi:glycerol-3-phosphate acyltransferase PlsY
MYAAAVLVAAYLMGSVPTALWVSRAIAQGDIRQMGDGNMGARNVSRTLGVGAGVLVAVIDFCKGGFAVLLAQTAGLPLGWQMAAGTSAVLGHDFPAFAGFHGGQGFASTCGVFLVLMPLETVIGLLAFALVYALSHHSDLSAGSGMGLTFLLGIVLGRPWLLLVYVAMMFLLIPAKTFLLDTPQRQRVQRQRQRIGH